MFHVKHCCSAGLRIFSFFPNRKPETRERFRKSAVASYVPPGRVADLRALSIARLCSLNDFENT